MTCFGQSTQEEGKPKGLLPGPPNGWQIPPKQPLEDYPTDPLPAIGGSWFGFSFWCPVERGFPLRPSFSIYGALIQGYAQLQQPKEAKESRPQSERRQLPHPILRDFQVHLGESQLQQCSTWRHVFGWSFVFNVGLKGL